MEQQKITYKGFLIFSMILLVSLSTSVLASISSINGDQVLTDMYEDGLYVPDGMKQVSAIPVPAKKPVTGG